jgi:hypothetical protein
VLVSETTLAIELPGIDDLVVRRTTTQAVRSIKGQRPRTANLREKRWSGVDLESSLERHALEFRELGAMMDTTAPRRSTATSCPVT